MSTYDGRSAAGRPAGWWRESVLSEERAGELLTAFDLAQRGLEEHPADIWLRHRAVLALARAGATAEAERRFAMYGLADKTDEDIAALGARIAKDRALAADGAARHGLAALAANRYAAISARTGGYYTTVNAATLWLLAGDDRRARHLARVALERVAASGEDSYYAAATEAEANLLLADARAACEALERAAERHGRDYGALASTRRQLRLVCDLTRSDQGMLRALAGPAVVHFCGHRIAPDEAGTAFAARDEVAVAAQIAAQVKRHRAGYAYGSLASGADILWAEALLAAGSEVHIVLPFARDAFIARSIAPAGPEWITRFEHTLEKAKSVRYATADTVVGDDILFRYASDLAMGLALLRARYLAAEARQLAVWDGEDPRGAAGTSSDTATWRHAGQWVTVVPPDGGPPTELGPIASLRRFRGGTRPDVLARPETPARVVGAMLYGDFKDFSRLTDEQMPVFTAKILNAIAEVLHRKGDAVWFRNTWGDGLCVVLSDPVRAAACALELQEALTRIDLDSIGLPEPLGLRLAGHLGPIFRVHDPVLERWAFTGSHVSRTARIEPVTPPGVVYVTEAFAAALTLAGDDRFGCDYVGHMPAAKGYGRLRMYRLRRRWSGGSISRRRAPVKHVDLRPLSQ
jgi:Adenylate and Guanylate cyclase catalytic domain